jgi:hypothetical protein
MVGISGSVMDTAGRTDLADLSATRDCGISMSHRREFGMTVAPGIAALYAVPMSSWVTGWLPA